MLNIIYLTICQFILQSQSINISQIYSEKRSSYYNKIRHKYKQLTFFIVRTIILQYQSCIWKHHPSVFRYHLSLTFDKHKDKIIHRVTRVIFLNAVLQNLFITINK